MVHLFSIQDQIKITEFKNQVKQNEIRKIPLYEGFDGSVAYFSIESFIVLCYRASYEWCLMNRRMRNNKNR